MQWRRFTFYIECGQKVEVNILGIDLYFLFTLIYVILSITLYIQKIENMENILLFSYTKSEII